MFRKKEQRLELSKQAWASSDYQAFLGPDVPHFVRTRRRLAHYLTAGSVLLCLGISIGRMFIGPSRLEPYWMLIGAAVGIFESTRLILWERRLARQLREHDHLLCTHCGYPLRGSEEHGRCPECGTEYDHDSLRVAWTNLRWAFWKPRG